VQFVREGEISEVEWCGAKPSQLDRVVKKVGEEREMGKQAAVVLAVNGKRYEAAGVDPSMTLLEYLRTQTPVRGPKLGCGEGTCPPYVTMEWI
jgi:hypothetical protein